MRILKEALFVVVAATLIWGQLPPSKDKKPFDPKAYPSDRFRVSRKEYPFGKVTVRVINVKTLNPRWNDASANMPNYCGAWVEVLKGSQLLKRFSYPDIEPVGFSFGAFVPRRQIVPDYFAVVKEGDYNGRLLLVNSEGGVVDLPGGFYFVSDDKRFLISEYASDEPGFTVFDLNVHRTRVQRNDLDADDWYRDKVGYFFSEVNKPGHFDRLDLRNYSIVSIAVSEGDLRTVSKVQLDFDPRKKEDCLSTPQ